MEKNELINLIIDGLRRTIVHYGFWFNEAIHQFGFEEAEKMEKTVWDNGFKIIMKRLAKILGFEIDEDGVPIALKEKSEDELKKIINGVAINWLANDGVWFQAVEFLKDLNDAKRTNDSCWTKFSPYEAKKIKDLLNLEENPGLEGLKKALQYRMYAFINKWSIEEPDDKNLIFKMNDCRVQSARKRKGLPDYPCKTAGLVEYSYFAKTIDKRIKTECICCPPDEHPEEYYCAWRFTINE